MLSVMCSLLWLVSKNITFAFFFASLSQRLSEMWEKKCDFTVTINKPISSSPTGKGYVLHTKRNGKVLSNFETMLVKNMAVVPHLLCLLDVACVVAFATMRKFKVL
jgi:hypothetical protein